MTICKLHLLPLYFLAAAAIVGAAGCSDSDNLPEDPFGELVVEGWLDSDGHPNILLTRSIRMTSAGDNLDNALVRWGVVEISDGDNSVILTGKIDKNYFPPYRYSTTEMRGVPGKTYTLTASDGIRKVHAECTMLPEPTIDSICFRRIEGSDSLLSASLYFTAPESTPAYYHLSTAVAGTDTRLLPAMFGSYEVVTPGKTQIPVYRGKNIADTAKFSPQWIEGTAMVVRLERISEAVYRFWKTFDEEVMFGNSPFIGTSENLQGNISGGLGYFSAQGATTLTIPVSPRTYIP